MAARFGDQPPDALERFKAPRVGTIHADA